MYAECDNASLMSRKYGTPLTVYLGQLPIGVGIGINSAPEIRISNTSWTNRKTNARVTASFDASGNFDHSVTGYP